MSIIKVWKSNKLTIRVETLRKVWQIGSWIKIFYNMWFLFKISYLEVVPHLDNLILCKPWLLVRWLRSELGSLQSLEMIFKTFRIKWQIYLSWKDGKDKSPFLVCHSPRLWAHLRPPPPGKWWSPEICSSLKVENLYCQKSHYQSDDQLKDVHRLNLFSFFFRKNTLTMKQQNYDFIFEAQ